MKTLTLILSFVCFGLALDAQITSPPSGNNQKAIVTQYIGSVAKVTVKYNSPAVKGRTGKIWGALVPWGLSPNTFGTAPEIPWRAGANENTVFAFSHDVMINGEMLNAGAYGFHIIPQENGPWTLIFSKTTDAWGSYYYDKSEDVLRVEANPTESEFKEFLTYEFIERGGSKAVLALMWENLGLPITIEVANSEEIYVAQMKEELKSSLGFSWQNYIPAINYCVANNTHLEDALAWADMAVSGNFIGQKNFITLSTKASVLNKLERGNEADELMMEAIKLPDANSGQIHNYGRSLISSGQNDKALVIMTKNYEKHSGEWPTTVGMMRAYSALGNFKEAIKYAEMAIDQAPDSLNKNFLKDAVVKLKNNENIN